FVHLERGAALLRIIVGVLRALGQRNPVPLRQLLERLPEAEALFFHHELDHVPARAAREALVELVHHVNRERRCLLVVERAQPHEPARPGFPQLDVLPHHVFDPYLRLKLLDEIHGGPACIIPQRSGRAADGRRVHYEREAAHPIRGRGRIAPLQVPAPDSSQRISVYWPFSSRYFEVFYGTSASYEDKSGRTG